MKVLENQLEVEKAEWPFLRIGWVLMGVLVLMGALGLFGGGVLSYAEVGDNAVRIKYDKFLRYSLNSEIVINAARLSSDSSLSINSSYVDKIKIEEILPQPQSVIHEGEKLRIKFNSIRGNNVILYIKPMRRGSQTLELDVNGLSFKMNQFIFF